MPSSRHTIRHVKGFLPTSAATAAVKVHTGDKTAQTPPPPQRSNCAHLQKGKTELLKPLPVERLLPIGLDIVNLYSLSLSLSLSSHEPGLHFSTVPAVTVYSCSERVNVCVLFLLSIDSKNNKHSTLSSHFTCNRHVSVFSSFINLKKGKEVSAE